MPFNKNGTDLDAIFEPIGAATPRSNVGYRISGTDIANRYYPLTAGGTSPAATGYQVGGVDLANYFAATGTISTEVLRIEGDSGYTDDSGMQTITPNGVVVVDSARYRCGTGSLKFLGGGCSFTRTGDSLELGDSDFTIDFWLWSELFFENQQYALFVNYSSQGYQVLIHTGPSGNQDIPPTYLDFSVIGGPLYMESLQLDTHVTMSAWNHYAIVRSGNNMYFYINGTRHVMPSLTGAIPNSGSNATMGMISSIWLDHYRMTKEARWTTNFTLTDTNLGYAPGTLI